MLFSVIVPVYNRPEEIAELLESLSAQSYKDFEVLIIEDGSDRPCRQVVETYKSKLKVRYYFKENSGQGFSRNYGFCKAKADYFVVFDSDCILPPNYFEIVSDHLKKNQLDAWGGPDKAHPDFTPFQKAISYVMTSPFTTGGIRGRKQSVGTFQPRSFNMGISREVFEKTGGYRITRMGEDLEFSIRIGKKGFNIGLIEKAFVYHKRRTNFRHFFHQLHFFGRARFNIYRFHRDQVHLFHLLPSLALLSIPILLFLLFWNYALFSPLLLLPALYALLIFSHALKQERSTKVALTSLIAAFILVAAYGTGFLRELLRDPPLPDH